jgi:hypothetical protein
LPEAITSTEVSIDDHLPVHEYAMELEKRLKEAGDRLRQQQHQVRLEDTEEPSLYMVGDKVWLKSFFKRRGQSTKLQPKYIGPYTIVEVLPYHVYKMERAGKYSIQHEGRIRLHVESNQTTQQNSASDPTLNRNRSTNMVTITDTTNEENAKKNRNGSRMAALMERRERVLSTPPPRAEGPNYIAGGLVDTVGCIGSGLSSTHRSGATVSSPHNTMDRDLLAAGSEVMVKQEPMETSRDIDVEETGTVLRRSSRQSKKPTYLTEHYYLET